MSGPPKQGGLHGMPSGRMSALAAPPLPAAPPFAEALAEMATPLILLDTGGTVSFANARAAALLACAEALGVKPERIASAWQRLQPPPFDEGG